MGGDYQLARRWFTGARYEFSDRAEDDDLRDRGEAVTLTFWPSEFSQIRGEFRRRRYAGGITRTKGFQLQFSIGPRASLLRCDMKKILLHTPLFSAWRRHPPSNVRWSEQPGLASIARFGG